MENKIKSIKKKIEESNHFQIQRESVLLINQLLINEKSNQIFDSGVLLFIQLIYNPNTHVIESTIECIINLVKQKRISRELVLNKFIESISSLERTNVGVIVKAIILLSTDIEYMSKIIKETNNKGFSVFPLNRLTKQYALSKPQIYDSFSEEMETLLTDSSIPSSLIDQRFEFLKPLISNLLLNTNERPLESSLLHNTLIRIAHNVSKLYQPILSYLVSLLFLYSNTNTVSHSNSNKYQKIQYIRDLIDLIRFPPGLIKELTNDETFNKSILSIIYYLLNIFISRQNEKETSVRNCILSQIQELIQLSPTTLLWCQSCNSSSGISGNGGLNAPILVVLLLLLPSSLVCFQNKIFDILQSAIDTIPTITSKTSQLNKNLILNTLRLSISPLIRLLSTTTTSDTTIQLVQNENLKKLLKKIEILIFEISNKTQELLPEEERDEEEISNNDEVNIPILDIYLLDNFIPINLAWNLFFKEGNDKLKLELLPTWLNIVNSNLLFKKDYYEEELLEEATNTTTTAQTSNIDFSNEFLIYFLSPFLFYKFNIVSTENEIDIRIKTIQLLPNIVCRNSFELISIIPLFFYCIQHEESSNVVMELLTKLPELANNKDCFNSIIKILSMLEKGNSSGIMPSFILRLYCKLLKSNSLIFTKIEELIYSIIQVTDTTSSNYIENRISAAITIKEICEIDPNQAQELIQPLSQFLCKDNNANTLSISLEALAILCESEILSFTSAWNVIKKNLGQEDGYDNDKRSPLVLISLLEFFSKGAPLDFQGETILEQKTIDVISDIIRRIWNLTNHNDQQVVSKSYQTFAKFIESPLLNLELFDKINSKQVVLLTKLQDSNQVDTNLVYLLRVLLQRELNEKRTLKIAHQNLKQTKSISIFNNSGESNKIFELLNNELLKESRTGIKSGILGGLLWYNNDNIEEGNKVESKKEILVNFKLNNQILNESIEYLDNSRDLLNKLMISLGGWNKFMTQCFNAFKKNEVMRQSLPSGKKLSIKETNEKVYSDIESILVKNILESSSTVKAENSVYALIALSKTTSTICYSQMENTVNQLIKWVTSSNQGDGDNDVFNGQNSDLVISASYLGLGILLPCLLQDSPLIKESINLLEFASCNSESKLDPTIKFNCYLSLGICSLKLSSFKHQSEKKRINLILFNNFINTFNNNTDYSPISISGLCLSIGYCSESFEQLSMTTELLSIYQIIESKLIKNQQFINDNNLAYGFTLISFSSIISSCYKLSLIKSDEILNNLIPNVYNQGGQQQQTVYQCIGYNNLIQSLLSKGFTGIELSTIQQLLVSNNSRINDGSSTSASLLINSILSTSILLGSPILSQSSSTLFESNLESSVLDFINSKPNSRKEFQGLLIEIINSMIKLFKSPNTDSKVVRYIAICLGSITLPVGNSNNNNIGVGGSEPENLDHLSNDLLIKGIFNILVDSNSGCSSVESCLRVFTELESNNIDGTDYSNKLPIVNWGSVIKRINNQFGRDDIMIKKQCIEFVCCNIKLSTLSIVMSEWLSVSNFKNSNKSIQKKLIKSLPRVVNQLTSVRVSSIFDEIISFSIIDEPLLIWSTLDKVFNNNQEMSKEIKDIITRFITINIKNNLPSPFNEENERLSSENMKLLKIASKSISHLSKDQISQCLGLLSGIVDIDYEAKIQYLYVLVLSSVNSSMGKTSLSNFYKIKSWCFSSTTPQQQSKVLSILPHILTLPLIKNQDQFGLDLILNDIFDSITLSSKQHFIGLELLSQLISYQIDFSIFEFNSFFNLYNNINISDGINENEKSLCNMLISFRYLEFLPYYLQVLFCNRKKNHQLKNFKIVDFINRFSNILQSKSTELDSKTKSILFSSILTLYQLKSDSPSTTAIDSVDNQMQQLNIFNLYKILKSSPTN